MKRKDFLKSVAIAAGAVAVAPVLLATGSAQAAGRNATRRATTSATTLDGNEVAGLNFMREEEKVAHDVYVALYALWGTPVFSNIASSEASHMAAMLNLLSRYGLVDPAASNPPGVFTDHELQMLYDTLMAQGRKSEIEALKVGALIEETDIQDIKDRMALTDEPAIISVYQSLLCGSRNHLRAFNRQLVNRGVKYVPEVITQAEWDAIANASNETCR